MNYTKAFLKSKGELITILRTVQVQFYASLKRSTRATYSLIAREDYFEGLCDSDSNIQGGELFTLRSETYLVQTADLDPESGELTIFVVRTNALIDVKREAETVGETGNISKTWATIFSSVPVYLEIATRSLKQEDEGLVDQAIYNIQVASSKNVTVMDRIVLDGKNYKADSKDPGMKGIDRFQLSPDFRP